MTWRQIPGFHYEVSDHGAVRNTVTGQPLRNGRDKDGYMQVTLWRAGKPYMRKVHRLVAQGFLSNPENKPEVNHKNGNRGCNLVENIEWATVSENKLHSYRVLRRDPVNRRKILARLCDSDVVEIFESTKAAKRAGHNRAAIYLCLSGKQKRHHDRRWEYA
jgi:hypothetical protein